MNLRKLVVNEQKDQPITASTSTANLIKNASAKDGSGDNVVDSSTCFDIKFPYAVKVNGLEITIDSISDLNLIEEIIDGI